MIKWFLAILFTISASTSLFGQGGVSDSTSAQKKDKGSWVPLPVILASPENGVGFGALGLRLFKFDYENTLTRTSNIQAFVIYTTRNQLLLSPSYTIFTPGEKYLLTGEINYNIFPDFFYGIGDDTPDENEEEVEYNILSFEHRFLKRIKPNFFSGFEFRYFNRFNIEREDQSLLEQQQVTGFDGSIVAGGGPVLVYDTRDIIVNPSSGHYLEFSAFFHGEFLGGEYNFERYRIDARKYFQLKSKRRQILAFQFVGNFVNGTAPFKQLSELGGDQIMRGYFQGRFRDQHLMALQGEYRFDIWRRFGAVVFAGLGDVANEFNDFDFQNIKPSYGGGLRFAVNKKERVNVRIDFGVGRETTGFYFNITEAF
ncbi:MAG: BamA/TamA family outer membrane protein [Bacteroidota bacterium]